MTRVISWPFRVDPATRAIASVETGTVQEAAEAITILALTRRGEREMCPGFGTDDPSMATITLAEDVQAGLALWGPDGVTVTGQTVTPTGDGRADVVIEFDLDGATSTSVAPVIPTEPESAPDLVALFITAMEEAGP